ncbi:MAG TPA: methyltransferase domain-containing protein, partial [Thermoanaerobaculia bacterium]|nr:methyltransferase domain-containing protein [Thermoanaerobaculia bacterium]
GWLSRFLTQLGCRAILLDVSETALRIARELYARQPVIGDRPAPEYVTFDARRIPLDDESVDRILCFDAFHHAPNPDEILREFARVLRPGGIAAFAEPGPHHSKTPQSQFEMRTYNVVENDVDIDAIWANAKDAGFTSLRLAVFHIPPFHVTLEDYEDLLRGGGTALRWASSTRTFLESTRNFFLAKGGEPPADSRRADALACTIELDAPARVTAGEPIVVHVRVKNTGRAVWLPFSKEPGNVGIGFHIYDANERVQSFDIVRVSATEPPRAIESGETVERDVTLPPLAAGTYFIEADCVAERVAWFSRVGSTPARVKIVAA